MISLNLRICGRCAEPVTEGIKHMAKTKEEIRIYNRAYYKANREKFRDWAKAYKKENREKLRVYNKAYQEANSESIRVKAQAYNEINKERNSANSKAYQEKNREKIRTRRKAFSLVNKKRLNAINREYYKNNKDRARVSGKIYHDAHKKERGIFLKNKWATDPKFRLNQNMSVSIGRPLRGSKGGRHWEHLVGYNLKQLKKHIERQFQPGMTWENYGKGGWEIDHIVPMSVFNFTKPEDLDFKRCWALKNLQPMWGSENISKGAKLDKHFQPMLAFG